MDVRDAGVHRVLAGKRQHLVGHVQPVGDPRGADPPGREDDVDPAAGAQVEHDLALVQIGNRDRVATAERGEHRCLGQLAALLGVVEQLAEGRIRRVVRAARAAPASAVTALALGHCAGGLGVPGPHLLA